MGFKDLLFKPAPQDDTTPAPATSVSPLAARLRSMKAAPGPVAPDYPATNLIAQREPVRTADAAFTVELVGELQKGSLPGYPQFCDQVELLDGVVPDETVRLKTALASTAKFLGLTNEQVIASIQERADILARARETFRAELSGEVEQRTTTYQRHLSDVTDKLAANALERDRLMSDRADTERQLAEIKSETQAVQTRFEGAYTPLYDQIASILQRVR